MNAFLSLKLNSAIENSGSGFLSYWGNASITRIFSTGALSSE